MIEIVRPINKDNVRSTFVEFSIDCTLSRVCNDSFYCSIFIPVANYVSISSAV